MHSGKSFMVWIILVVLFLTSGALDPARAQDPECRDYGGYFDFKSVAECPFTPRRMVFDGAFAYVPAGLGWEGDYAYRLTYLLRTGTVAFSFDATRDGRYYVAIGDGLISLVKQDANGDKTMLAQAEAPEIEVQHYLVIAKQEGKIQVYVDRTLWLAAEDRSPLTQGTIIVGSVEGTDAWVDNVMVNKILVTLPDDSPAVAAIDPSQAVEPADGGADLSQLPESDDQAPDLPDANLPLAKLSSDFLTN